MLRKPWCVAGGAGGGRGGGERYRHPAGAGHDRAAEARGGEGRNTMEGGTSAARPPVRGGGGGAGGAAGVAGWAHQAAARPAEAVRHQQHLPGRVAGGQAEAGVTPGPGRHPARPAPLLTGNLPCHCIVLSINKYMSVGYL